MGVVSVTLLVSVIHGLRYFFGHLVCIINYISCHVYAKHVAAFRGRIVAVCVDELSVLPLLLSHSFRFLESITLAHSERKDSLAALFSFREKDKSVCMHERVCVRGIFV